jgi:hypothetical protein
MNQLLHVLYDLANIVCVILFTAYSTRPYAASNTKFKRDHHRQYALGDGRYGLESRQDLPPVSTGRNQRCLQSGFRQARGCVEFPEGKNISMAGGARGEMSATQNKNPMSTGLKLTAINPTDDHPCFSQAEQAMKAGDQPAREQVLTRLLPKSRVDALTPVLALAGISLEGLLRNGEISWDDAITAAGAIEQNLPQLGGNENLRKWWLRVAKEWRFSGGLRLWDAPEKVTITTDQQ